MANLLHLWFILNEGTSNPSIKCQRMEFLDLPKLFEFPVQVPNYIWFQDTLLVALRNRSSTMTCFSSSYFMELLSAATILEHQEQMFQEFQKFNEDV